MRDSARCHADSCDCSVDAISRSSAGLEGWANYEKQQVNKIEPHIDDESSDCSEVIGPLVVPGDAPGFMAFGSKAPNNHVSGFSYAKKGLSQFSDKDASEWTMIEVTVDSGACVTVMPLMSCSNIPMVPSKQSKAGMSYEVADGGEIPNLGERKFLGCMEDGTARAITAQVCAVNQTLMSVSKIASKGNRVVFDDDGSYIEEKSTGVRTWMTQVGGMYSLKMWVSRKSTKEAGF